MKARAGVCLRDIWPFYLGRNGKVVKAHTMERYPMDWMGKEITRVVSGYIQKLWSISFNGIGSFYLRADLERLAFKSFTFETKGANFV